MSGAGCPSSRQAGRFDKKPSSIKTTDEHELLEIIVSGTREPRFRRRRDETGGVAAPSLAGYIPQRSAGVCTGASQWRLTSSSNSVTVSEQPAMSREVT